MSNIKTIILALMCVIFQDSIQAAQVRAGLIYAARRGSLIPGGNFSPRVRIGRYPIDPCLLPTLVKVEPAENTQLVCPPKPTKNNSSFLSKLREHVTAIRRLNNQFIKGNKKQIQKTFLYCCGGYLVVKSNIDLEVLSEFSKSFNHNNNQVYLIQSKINSFKKKK